MRKREMYTTRQDAQLIKEIRILAAQLEKRQNDLIEEAILLDKGGIKELTLVAQDLTAYGYDLGKERCSQTKDCEIAKFLSDHKPRLEELLAYFSRW